MSRKVRKNVGVIGLGIIGTRVAAGLRAGGYQVYVWNRSAKPAPNFLGSPAEVAESAEVIQIFVSDAQALFDVVEAMSEVLTPKHVVVCNSTVGPEAVIETAQLVQARGAQFLDAPFTGSKLAAEKRELVYYVGGAEQAFQRVRPILELTSKNIVRMGEIGHASTIKVVTNMISAVTTQVLAESLAIVQKAGLEPEMLTAALEMNACRSGVIDLKLPKMMSGDYEPHFSLKHMFKDVQLGIHMANALDIEIPATTVTAGVMYGALNQSWGDFDFSVLFKNYTPSPPEGLEGLPTLGQALADAAPAGEEGTRTPSGKGTLVALTSGELPFAKERSDEVPLIPIIDAISVTAEPESGSGSGAPARELAPTEEAARIIEAVLAHLTSQRQELGALLNEHRNHFSKGAPVRVDTVAIVAAPSTKKTETEEKPATAVTPVGETAAKATTEETKPAASSKPGEKDDKGGTKPISFVRRWFVGRSQT